MNRIFREEIGDNIGKWMTVQYRDGNGYVGELLFVESDYIVMGDAAEKPNRMTIKVDAISSFICHAKGERMTWR